MPGPRGAGILPDACNRHLSREANEKTPRSLPVLPCGLSRDGAANSLCRSHGAPPSLMINPAIGWRMFSGAV
jgi:hypothetical protein